MVFEPETYKPVYGRTADNCGGSGRIGGWVYVHVTPAARYTRADAYAIVVEEYELCATADKPALVGLLKLDADIVCFRGFVDIVLEGDVFYKETVLEPEEGEQVYVEPFLDVV